jgi:predicted RND superfamily exporter protein
VVDHAHASAAEKRARIENLWLQRPGLVVGIIVVLCALAATQIGKVYFDYNLLNMQSAGLPAVEFEKDLITATNASSKTNSSPKSVLYAAIIATNLAQAVAFEQQLTNLPAVAGVESMSKYLAENPTRKLALIAEVKKELCSVHFDEPDAKP